VTQDHELRRAIPNRLTNRVGQVISLQDRERRHALGLQQHGCFKSFLGQTLRRRSHVLHGDGPRVVGANDETRCGIRDQSHRFVTIRDVRDLLLILPDLNCDIRAWSPEEESLSALPALRWPVAPAQLERRGWRERLAQALGQRELANRSVASVLEAARAAAAGVPASPSAWVATPMHWQSGLTQVHAPLDSLLHLPQDEVDELVGAFAITFAGSGLRLLPAGSVGFLLHGLTVGSVTVDEPAKLRGRNLAAHQPQGEGAAQLRALMSEIEMWLHDQPLNRRREVRGAAGISSLWLWGGGDSVLDVARAAPTHRAMHGVSDEAWVEAACELLRWPHHALPREARALMCDPLVVSQPDGLWVVVLNGWDLTALQRDWLHPICDGVRTGFWNSLQIDTADRAVRLHRRDRWCFWRRSSNPLTRLLDAGVSQPGDEP
jgi:hypothetical protein